MERNDSGVVERDFLVSVDGADVPGVIWRPAGVTGPLPAVLAGHGRMSHKSNAYTVALAQLLAGHGFATVALDAPGHGDRRAADETADWPRPDPDQVVREWRACVASVGGDIDTGRLGYWGVSMGSGLGISVLADGSIPVRAAVLGLMHPNWPAPPGERIRADAALVSCPVLFIVNWADQLAPKERAFELYDLLGGADKRLHGYPGGHGQLPPESFTASADFLVRHLA